ncbi:hypothetical protein [Pedobacter sp. SYP-B3415]|uniref:hypothetical protein n=1 Tax=Pedobacter sp. SYP-B3415 TaxID=2496641 RepID=UPI00101BCB57|nr:hypothetical protein [Pedobacter sp. SYP-B3415]
MLRKALSVFLLLISLALAAVLVIFYARYLSARQTLVPPEAKRFVSVHTDEIVRKLFFDRLFNRPRSETLNRSGLQIPARLYFYELRDGWYTLFECQDGEAFDRFIKNRQTGLSQLPVPMRWFRQGSKVALVVFPGPAAARMAQDLLQRSDLQPVSESMAGRLEGADVVFADQKNRVVMDSGDGTITFTAALAQGTFVPPDHSLHREFARTSAVRFWLQGDFSQLNMPSEIKLGRKVWSNTSSLSGHLPSYIDGEWSGTVVQAQQEVRYVFNDDFEKVAETLQVRKKVPAFFISAAAAPGKKNLLYMLLGDKQALSPAGRLEQDVFPLYDLEYRDNGHFYGLGTAPGLFSRPRLVKSTDFMTLEIDFDRLEALAPSIRSVAAPLNDFRMRGFKTNAGITLQGVLRFKAADKNPLNAIF